MNKIGITRRIDELGRIVIPKEIRKNMHINSGELLEIDLENENIILKKHSILENEEKFINSFISYFSKVFKTDVFIIDQNKIIFSNKIDYIGNKITSNISELSKIDTNKNQDKIKLSEEIIIKDNYKIFPLLPNGDFLGLIIFNSINDLPNEEILRFCYNFVEKYLEDD